MAQHRRKGGKKYNHGRKNTVSAPKAFLSGGGEGQPPTTSKKKADDEKFDRIIRLIEHTIRLVNEPPTHAPTHLCTHPQTNPPIQPSTHPPTHPPTHYPFPQGPPGGQERRQASRPTKGQDGLLQRDVQAPVGAPPVGGRGLAGGSHQGGLGKGEDASSGSNQPSFLFQVFPLSSVSYTLAPQLRLLLNGAVSCIDRGGVQGHLCPGRPHAL